MIRREVQIGDCRLLLGDCLEILPSLGRVDAVFTSPPYNCGKDYGAASDDLSNDEFAELVSACVNANARIRVVNVGQFVGSRSKRVLFRDIVASVSRDPIVDEVLWDKGPASGAAWGNYPNSPRIRAQHESIFAIGTAKMPNGNGLSWQEWSSLTTSIWRIAPNVSLDIHPAQMPLEVARRCVSLWSDTAGVALDPFMGSGTTGVACVKLGRKFIGIEIDEGYFNIACERIRKAYAQPDMFIERAPEPKQEVLSL